jgi:hypothetical protein
LIPSIQKSIKAGDMSSKKIYRPLVSKSDGGFNRVNDPFTDPFEKLTIDKPAEKERQKVYNAKHKKKRSLYTISEKTRNKGRAANL